MKGQNTDEGNLKLLGEGMYKMTLKDEGVLGVGSDETDRGKDRKGVGC